MFGKRAQIVGLFVTLCAGVALLVPGAASAANPYFTINGPAHGSVVSSIPSTPAFSYTDNFAFQSTPTCDYTGTGLADFPQPCNGAHEKPTAPGIFLLTIAGTIVQLSPSSVIGAQSDTISFEYDPYPPTLTIDSPAAGAELNQLRPPISFTTTENPLDVYGGVTTTCSIDGGPAEACTSPFTPSSDLAQGSRGIVIIATDGANTVYASRTFIVDTVAPVVNVTFPTPGAVVDSSVPEVTLGIEGATAGSFCKFDDQPFQSCGPTWLGGTLADGAHTLTVRGVDLAGNETVVVVPFSVDDSLGATPVPVETSITGGKGGKVRRGKFKVKTGFSLLGPEGSSAAILCAAKVTATIKPKGGRTYRDRIQLLNKNGRCVASTTFNLPERFKGKRAKLTFRYPGTAALGALSRSKTIRKL